MPVIEILAYSPNEMNEFIAFVIDGKRKPNGEYELDDDGQEITGVIKWLLGRGVPEAYFFNSADFFASTVQKPDNEPPDRPWMKEIPGFDVMVKTDGLIGTSDSFAPFANLLDAVASNADLDARFVAGRQHVAKVLESIRLEKNAFSFGEDEFLAALRGDKGSSLQTVLAELGKTSAFSLEVKALTSSAR